MPSIKEYNVKIKSLKNTCKITKTMKMVSASKLRKAQEAQANAKLYARHITDMTSRISSGVESSLHPLLVSHKRAAKALILIITSDKGLCGAFNHNAHKQVHMWIKENEAQYETIHLSCCGKRGYNFFRRRGNIRKHYENVISAPSFPAAKAIGDDFMSAFMNKEYDEIYVAYNQFFSPLSQKTVFEKLLPIDPHGLIEEKIKQRDDYIFEPEAKQLLSFLIPHFLYFKVYFALLENAAGEHGARMTAMDNATKNASDLIDKYTLFRNRARQAQITTELTEIVAGAEAL